MLNAGRSWSMGLKSAPVRGAATSCSARDIASLVQPVRGKYQMQETTEHLQHPTISAVNLTSGWSSAPIKSFADGTRVVGI